MFEVLFSLFTIFQLSHSKNNLIPTFPLSTHFPRSHRKLQTPTIHHKNPQTPTHRKQRAISKLTFPPSQPRAPTAESWKLPRFPRACTTWPTPGVRRATITGGLSRATPARPTAGAEGAGASRRRRRSRREWALSVRGKL